MVGKAECNPLELSFSTKVVNQKQPCNLNYRDLCYIKDLKGSELERFRPHLTLIMSVWKIDLGEASYTTQVVFGLHMWSFH